METFKKAKAINWNLDVTVDWVCPECGTLNNETIYANPYRMLAEDPPDVDCKNCNEYFTLDFYDE